MSAAVRRCKKNGEGAATFMEHYRAMMRHCGLAARLMQPGGPQENGAVEQRHYRLKQAVADALMLPGNLDVEDRAAYEHFIATIVDKLHASHRELFKKEAAKLRTLPRRRLETFTGRMARVANTSMVTVLRNTYSAHSRLIGEKVEVRVYPEHLEVWYAQRKMESMPRLRGRGHHDIQYRHVID